MSLISLCSEHSEMAAATENSQDDDAASSVLFNIVGSQDDEMFSMNIPQLSEEEDKTAIPVTMTAAEEPATPSSDITVDPNAEAPEQHSSQATTAGTHFSSQSSAGLTPPASVNCCTEMTSTGCCPHEVLYFQYKV